MAPKASLGVISNSAGQKWGEKWGENIKGLYGVSLKVMSACIPLTKSQSHGLAAIEPGKYRTAVEEEAKMFYQQFSISLLIFHILFMHTH